MLRTLAALPASLLLLLIRGGAWMFSPFGLGRMLRTVSVPRMREHPMRTTFTILGVASGVAMLTAVLLVNRSVAAGVTATIDDVAGKADFQITAGTSGFDEALVDELRGVAGDVKLTPVLQQATTFIPPHGERDRMLVIGVDLLGSEERYFRDYGSPQLDAIRKDPLQFLNSPANILVSRALAKRYGLKVHDQIGLETDSGFKQFTIWGFIDDRGPGRAFGGALGIMYYPAMQVAFGRAHNVDRIDVGVDPAVGAPVTAERLRQRLGSGFNIDRPATRGERVDKMLASMHSGLLFASLIAVVAGAFVVVNTLTISVIQRRRELAILRALGARSGQVLALVTFEGTLLGLVGSGIGLLLGLWLSRGLLAATSRAVNDNYIEHAVGSVQLDMTKLLLALGLGLGSASVAAFMAARRAAEVSAAAARGAPVSVARKGQGATRRSNVVGIGLLLLSFGLLQLPPLGAVPVGALVAIATLTFAGLALMPRFVAITHAAPRIARTRLSASTVLANENLPRDIVRTASTASGLMVAVALTCGIATFIASFVHSIEQWAEQSVPGDLFVTSGTALPGLGGRNTPMSDDLSAVLSNIAGIAQIRRIRFVEIDFRTLPVKLVSTDVPVWLAHAKPRLSHGDPARLGAALARGAVAVSENLARRLDLHLGDRIELSTRSGTRRFEIAAVIVDYTSDLGTIIMDRTTYVAQWDDTRVDTFEVHLASRAQAGSVRREINRLLGERFNLFVLTNAQFRDTMLESADKVFSLLRVEEVITFLVGAFSLVTSVLATVLERTREIGILRAVGMLRSQIRRMIFVEAALVGVIGTCSGLLVGAALGYVIVGHVTDVQLGWHLPFRLPWKVMLELLVALVPIAAVAGFLPARRAASLMVSDALDYE